jgi:hypothetical protein
VSGFLVQGRGEVGEWTTLFSVAYSQDAFRWDFVQDLDGRKRVSASGRLGLSLHKFILRA